MKRRVAVEFQDINMRTIIIYSSGKERETKSMRASPGYSLENPLFALFHILHRKQRCWSVLDERREAVGTP